MNKLVYVKPLLAAAAVNSARGAFAAKWTVVPETSTVSFIGAQQERGSTAVSRPSARTSTSTPPTHQGLHRRHRQTAS
jgi:hypothetical protein